MLRLPKDILDHPRQAELEAYFTAHEQPLRAGSGVIVSAWPFDAGLRQGLGAAFRSGHLTQGLEHAAALLDREQKGLKATQQKTGVPGVPRLSRLLFLSADGSERFYRDAETLLAKHAERAWGCLVAAPAEELGRTLTAKGQPAKLLMIDDRKAIGAFLATLAGSLPASG